MTLDACRNNKLWGFLYVVVTKGRFDWEVVAVRESDPCYYRSTL